MSKTMLLARLGVVVAAPDSASGRFMYMPGGRHKAVFTSVGSAQGIEASVLVNRDTAGTLQRQLELLSTSGGKPYFDFNHEDAAASLWPKKFAWDDSPRPGVYVEGDWSGNGQASIAAKEYSNFSPVFWVDDPNGNQGQSCPDLRTRRTRHIATARFFAGFGKRDFFARLWYLKAMRMNQNESSTSVL